MAPSVCPEPTQARAGAAASPSSSSSSSSPVDWSRVRLGVDPAPTMFVARWSPDPDPASPSGGHWDGGELVPYGPLALMPAAQVLNYGQSIFEGLKAYRRDAPPTPASATTASGSGGDGAGGMGSAAAAASAGPGPSSSGSVLLFRPDANAERFAAGARRMAMPPVPPAMFLAALHAVVRANRDWVPPASRGSLYLRPLLLGTGPLLGLCPAPSYTFIVYAMPVGSRAKDGRLTPLDYLIHDSLHRAAPRGVGSTKAAGNYSPCLVAQAQAREQGCHDCLYLDAKSDTYLEEGSGCNVFVAHGSVISTPPAAGSILPGVTRASLMQLAAELGYRVREAPVSVAEAMKADEMFASGTAVVVQPIGSLTYRGARVRFPGAAATTAPAAAANAGAANSTSRGPVEADGAPEHLDSSSSNAASSGVSCAVSGSRTSSASGSGCSPVVDGVLASELEEPLKAEVAAGGAAAATAVKEKEAAAEGEDEEEAAAGLPSYLCGFGRTVPYLTPEQRAALAAAAPPPEPSALQAGVGPIAQRLYGLLTGIQYGRVADPFGWSVEVDMEGPTAGPLHLDLWLEELEAAEAAEAEAQQQEADGESAGTSEAGSPPARRRGSRVGAGCGIPPVSSMDSFGRAPSLSSKRAAKLAAAGGRHRTAGAGAGGQSALPARSVFADPNLE